MSGAYIKGQRRLVLALVLALVTPVARAQAQSLNPGPPGPFVIDIRGVTSGVPSSEAFVTDDSGTATLATRGFGGDLGGHVYFTRVGPVRLGAGADLMFVRGTTDDVKSTFTSIDPQLSFNFGTSDGWSYLSAGLGAASVKVEPGGVSESVRVINWGGGARWFLGPHLGVGFDVRIRMLAAGEIVPKGTSVAIAAGVSLK